MLTFAWNFSVAFIAATLIVSGAGHVAGFRRFVTTVQSHGLVPIRLSFCVAALVTVLEVAGGGIAFAALGFTGASPIGETYFVGCAAMGLAYLFYVRRLLQRRDTVASCGCSPLASAVTPASLVPSAGLLATSCVGLAVSVLGTPALMRVGEMAVYSLLAVCWGVTLAGIVLVYPAVVPAAVREGGR